MILYNIILLPYCVIQQIDLDIYMRKLKNSLVNEKENDNEHI